MPPKKDIPMTMELFEASTKNQVLVGGVISKKEIRKGTEKKDKQGNPILNPDGSTQVWADKHNVTFDFQGGSNTFTVPSDDFNRIEEGLRYQLVGKVVMKNPFGEGNPYISLEVLSFEFLF